ncbi:Starch-binding associating with outer membrane [Aquimarina amphilecti]|uniref:Starch-binding associating with outer membrane n=1 Tax=Aquimarina amphilecti TaxID=1038014 RepID=A0A1H7SMH2_AQUAM|nr:RagB/SusD family nutrient uptake outer membrane protein [Aquimarina amphilecti]SEL73316.1 Starch-binding associating with outer membrane [Aquimarina amphilecti]
MIKFTNHWRKLSVCLSFFMVSLSCSDDFTNVEPEFEVGIDEFFQTEQDYFEALIGAYDLLQATWQTQFVGEFMSDNSLIAGEIGCTDQPQYQELERFSHTPSNTSVGDRWDSFFAGVYRCDFFLDNADRIEFDGKNGMIAEVVFLKAFYYFELARNFGGLPFKDSAFVVGDAEKFPRVSVEDTYSRIEDWLMQAIPNLPTTQEQSGRATRGAALALLGKVYLYQNDWDNVILYLEQVTSLGYSLVPNYSDIFQPSGENGPESIFEIQFSSAKVGNWGDFSFLDEEGNIGAWFSGPRYRDDVYAGGYSFNLPQADLVDEYESTDSRKAATILDIFEFTGFADEAALETEFGGVVKGCSTDVGFYFEKIITKTVDYESENEFSRSSHNYRYMRYADVLLMLAEAHNKRGEDNIARSYLRQVVDRAHGAGVVDLSVSGQSMEDRIQLERRLEFAGEGHRYYDLVRTGNAQQVIDAIYGAGTFQEKHMLFPIPQDEIEFAKGNWVQNTGW